MSEMSNMRPAAGFCTALEMTFKSKIYLQN